MRWNIVGMASLCVFAVTAHAEEFVLPPNDGFITDPSDVIPLAEEDHLEQKMAEEREQRGIEIVSVVLPTLVGRDIVHTAWEIRTKWGIEKHGSGILLLIAREEGKTLIAPGKNQGHILTDRVLKGIIEMDILPHLRVGAYALAIEEGTNAIRKHLSGEYTEKRYQGGIHPLQKGHRTLFLLFLLLLILGVSYVGARAGRRSH